MRGRLGRPTDYDSQSEHPYTCHQSGRGLSIVQYLTWQQVFGLMKKHLDIVAVLKVVIY